MSSGKLVNPNILTGGQDLHMKVFPSYVDARCGILPGSQVYHINAKKKKNKVIILSTSLTSSQESDSVLDR